MRILIFFLSVCACISVRAQTDIITTIAGKEGQPGNSGDGGPATNAKLYGPESLTLDKSGSIFIADVFNNKIRKIDYSSGIITTIVGQDTLGFYGDGGPASEAKLFLPSAIRLDTAGNIYIADAGNNRIREVSATTGIINTIAGSGPTGVGVANSSGDGGPATDAQIGNASGLCFDKYNNLYIADYGNGKVRKVDAITGIITTVAGAAGTSGYVSGFVGYSGDGGSATNAVFSGVINVCVDSAENIYICDQWNHAVRKVDAATGIITTIAGTGVAGHSGDGGLAIHAQLSQPASVMVDNKKNVFIAEFGTGVIRKIDGVSGIISTIAGDSAWGWAGDGGPATDAELSCADFVFDKYGDMYIADYGTNTIRLVYNPKLAAPSLPPPEGEVVLYPNPARSSVTVKYDFVNDGEMQVMNMMGQVVIATTLSAAIRGKEIDVSRLSPGLYLFRVLQNNMQISAGKIIKE